MKFSKLLVLGVLLTVASSAMAEIVDGVRQHPQPASTTGWVLSADTTQNYYLYNVQAKAFFTEGNAWGTQASVGAKGLKVAFTDAQSEMAPGAVYFFNDFSLAKKAWKLVFFDSETAMFVDKGGQGNYGWAVDELPNGKFRLHMATANEYNDSYTSDNYPSMFVGLDVTENVGNTALSPILEEGEGHYIDWTFVTPEVYAAYEQAVAIYDKAQELKALIDGAKAQGVDVSAQEAVYLNENASLADIEAAIAGVKEAVSSNASVANPIDMTSSILNPTFENASSEGWKGTAPNMVGSGSHGPANVAEHYNKNFDTYQDLSGMPKGVYMLSATAGFRTTWADHVNHTNYVVHIYGRADGDTLTAEVPNLWDAMNTDPMAGPTEFGTDAAESSEEHDGVTYYIPNDPSAARLYFEKGLYDTNVFFALAGDEPIRVGIMKNQTVTGTDWVMFDNFKLTYYGNAADAYQYWVDQKKATKVDYSESEAKISPMYIEAYDNSFDATATNKAEAVAAMQAIQAASDSINQNINLWKKVAAKFEEGMQHTIGKYAVYSAAQELAEYMTIEMELEDLLNESEADLSNQELQDIIDTIDYYVEQILTAVKNQLNPGDDATEYLTNPDFEENGGSSTGWTIVSKGGGNVQLGGNSDNHCFEAWHSTNFDIYQEVTGLPIGVYEISVQGYVRYKDGQDAINAKDESFTVFEQGVPIYVYMNDSKTNLMNWFTCPNPVSFYEGVTGATFLSEDDDNAYPDNMTAASAAFHKKDYTQSAMGLVAHEGDVMRIGVKGTPQATFWPIFDNFKLTYQGFAADVVKPVLETTLASALQFQGITYKEAKDALNDAITEANAALGQTGEDAGTIMFTSLVKLESALNAAEEGKTACEELMAAVTTLMTEAQTSGAAIAAEAQQKGGELMSKLETSEMTQIEVESAKGTVKEYLLLLRLPDNYDTASEADPKDLTAFIESAGFSKMNAEGVEVNSLDGWQNTTNCKIGDDDTQKSALAAEFWQSNFDMYQDVEGVGPVVLPNGYYKLQVSAYAQNAPTAVIYAVGATTYEQAIIDIEEGLRDFDGVAKPSSLRTAGDAFEAGAYVNEMMVQVSENKLRIGVKYSDNKSSGDWIAMDNFKLIYYGTEPLAIQDINADSKAPVMKVEFYTIDGRKASFAQKGIMIQKMTLGDGTIVVKKIRK